MQPGTLMAWYCCFLCDYDIPIVLPWIMYLVNKTQEERTCCEKKTSLDQCHPTTYYCRRDIPLKTSPQKELEFQWTATRLVQYAFRFLVCRAAWHSIWKMRMIYRWWRTECCTSWYRRLLNKIPISIVLKPSKSMDSQMNDGRFDRVYQTCHRFWAWCDLNAGMFLMNMSILDLFMWQFLTGLCLGPSHVPESSWIP